MASSSDYDKESPIDVVTPPTVKKARASPRNIPKAAADGTGENEQKFSSTEVRLLVEMLSTLGENSSGIKFDWAAITKKLKLPSSAATAKRAERLLKRFDLKMSDITGGRGGRTPKGSGDITPGSKRKTGGGPDGFESPTKRRGRAKIGAKNEDGAQDNNGKKDTNAENDDVFI